jgi:hypothetical protein
MGLIRKSLHVGTAGMVQPSSKKQRSAQEQTDYLRQIAGGKPKPSNDIAQGFGILFGVAAVVLVVLWSIGSWIVSLF